MRTESFVRLVESGRNIVFDVLGQQFIVSADNDGNVEISDYDTGKICYYESIEEMLLCHTVMKLSLVDLTRWMRVKACA